MKNIIEASTLEAFVQEIKQLLHSARSYVASQVNTIMVSTYFEIGKRIVEQEQNGSLRAGYGENVLKELSEKLTQEFGKGFSTVNLRQMRAFYIAYEKQQTVSAKFQLSWSHYLKLMRISDVCERKFYEIECVSNNWSLRELQRQFDSALYQRLVLSRDKEKVQELAGKGQIIAKAQDILKDPYVLEFICLLKHHPYLSLIFFL